MTQNLGFKTHTRRNPLRHVRLRMLATKHNLSFDVYQAIMSGDYRVVHNTFDNTGGAFLMLGSAPAPGEETTQVPAKKKWWQFWK